MESEVIASKDMLIKSEKALIDLRESEEELQRSVSGLKREVKTMTELREELSIRLTTEQETKQKYAGMLSEEEEKNRRQNEFIAVLMRQKELAIKNEL